MNMVKRTGSPTGAGESSAWLSGLLCLAIAGCGGSSSDSTADAAPGGPDASTGPVVVHDSTACPHVDLGDRVPVSYDGSTAGLPDQVESLRLEWTDAPDDTLVFTAPADGDYVIYFESAEPGFGVSAREYGPEMNGRGRFYTAQDCSDQGPATIDGVYNDNQPDYPLPLTAEQTIMLWVSGAYWAQAQTTTYTLRIEML